MRMKLFIPSIIFIVVALSIMVRLMHYAPFYAPSYLFWIGIILSVIAIISLIKPLAFLLIFNRIIAIALLCFGLLLSATALCLPQKLQHSQAKHKIDTFLPDYSSDEYHEVMINASPEKVKFALHTTGVGDIPAAHLLMKIRGIADEKDKSHSVTKNKPNPDTFSTPDFEFIVADSDEFITVMILKASAKTPPPEVKTIEQFIAFNEPGYVKVVANFRFISIENGQTLLTTETRNYPVTTKDRRIFGRYWTVIYPGSAIIRRVWLDTMAKKAER
jgi:hypothetical protein